MAQNYVLLERIELNQSASSVTFSSIPQTGYTDLKIVVSSRVETTNDLMIMTLNSTTTGYSNRWLYGNGSSASSGNNGGYERLIMWTDTSDNTANTFNNAEVYIPNYTSSNYKSYSADFVTENNATGAEAGFMASLWSNTAAISSVKFEQISGNNFSIGSTFSLYGIANASTTPTKAPKASGGNVIATDGTYWYHAFLSNGTFTPQVGLTADVLVVAGGGGTAGSDLGGGGGGAGGLLGFTAQALAGSTNYACSIGSGGTGQANGGNSQFGALTAAVGGGKGATNAAVGATGGSGGGGAWNTYATGYAGTSGQGTAGGGGYTQSNYAVGGGGGGATVAGGNGTLANGGGLGGNGSSTYSAWGLATSTGQNISGTVWFGGGGGGGAYNGTQSTGGNGGGGAGGRNGGAAVNGTANTGGGAGGAGQNGAGANGGSGIVIVRYLVA